MEYDQDLRQLAKRLGGPVEKLVRILSNAVPDWRPGHPLKDRDILRLASLLGKGRNPQWKSMLLEMSNPPVRPLEREVANGGMELTPTLTTSFHKEFVTADFVEKVKACVTAHPALAGFGSSGYLIPAYNEEQYMGEQSVVKYRFNIAVVANRPRSPIRWHLSYNLDYRPKHDNFRIRYFSVSFEWQLDTLRNQLVREGAVTTDQFDQAVREAEASCRVDRLLGLVSPVRCLIAHDETIDSKIQNLLVANGGFAFLPESRLSESVLLRDAERAETYQTLLLDVHPLPYAVLSSVVTAEEFEYVQFGSEGAMPAFSEPGAVSKHLRRLTAEI